MLLTINNNINNCSGRHSESPSTNPDVVAQSGIQRTNLDSDSDMDVEDLWQNQVVPEELSNLSPQEKKRQDVINGKFFQHCCIIFSVSKTLFCIVEF